MLMTVVAWADIVKTPSAELHVVATMSAWTMKNVLKGGAVSFVPVTRAAQLDLSANMDSALQGVGEMQNVL